MLQLTYITSKGLVDFTFMGWVVFIGGIYLLDRLDKLIFHGGGKGRGN